MSGGSKEEVTRLLRAIEGGHEGADEELLRRLYAELLVIARSQLEGREAQTLQPTALVHEAYLRLLDRKGGAFENRRNFFFAAARAMRDVMVEQARRRRARDHGQRVRRSDLDELALVVEPPDVDVLALDEALHDLERRSPRSFELVQLRFFAGLDVRETAEVLEVSTRTVERDWRFVRALLHLELTKGDDAEAPADGS